MSEQTLEIALTYSPDGRTGQILLDYPGGDTDELTERQRELVENLVARIYDAFEPLDVYPIAGGTAHGDGYADVRVLGTAEDITMREIE